MPAEWQDEETPFRVVPVSTLSDVARKELVDMGSDLLIRIDDLDDPSCECGLLLSWTTQVTLGHKCEPARFAVVYLNGGLYSCIVYIRPFMEVRPAVPGPYEMVAVGVVVSRLEAAHDGETLEQVKGRAGPVFVTA